jgi:UDP-N-acetylglucosamine acyltransferase
MKPGRGTVIGDDNIFREGVTVHRAMTDDGPTTIGSKCFFMCNAHAAHDVQMADACVLTNGALLGGHVIVDDHVTIGGNTCVHQFVHVGRGAMMGGGLALSGNLPPFFMLTGVNTVGSLNLIGMRRMGLSSSEIDEVRWVYRTIYRRGLPIRKAIAELRRRADSPIIAMYVEFLETSRRPLARGHVQAQRATGAAAPEPETVTG